MARTLYDKIWDEHVVHVEEDGTAVLYIDRHLLHEVTSPQAFEGLDIAARKTWRISANLAVSDEELRTLATRRAQVVQGWLVQQGQVPLSRIFLLPIQRQTTANGGNDTGNPRVNFSLR